MMKVIADEGYFA
jgi:hypothetical protein